MVSGVFSDLMRNPLIVLLCLGGLTTGAFATEPTALERLTACLTGTFSNADQAKGDQNFRAVTLHIAPVWPELTDGPWLYAEQSLSDAPDHPYRQHVYQLTVRPDGSLESRVFELSDPIKVTGAWKDPARFAQLKSTDLISRDGCTLIYHVQPDGSFKGAIEGNGCSSTLRGAVYTTSQTTVDEHRMTTWDRGYNAKGVQVWGSIHGGYEFKKVE